ncbi:MAG: hypothetical protein JWN48_1843 [Myxococcaceae bacterium]|nr:hypothetical protein [Myxococcaceae bacterium]
MSLATGVQVPRGLVARSRRGVVVAARIGYAAKGVVYAVLGVLALLAAFGDTNGRLTDSKGAIQAIGEQPFGVFLLWLTAAGLVCYAVWKGVCAALDPERKGDDGKGIIKRIGYGLVCLLHLALAYYAAELARGSSSGSGNGTQRWVGKGLSLPLGRALVALVGAITIAVGVAELVKAVKGKIGQQYAHASLDARLCRAVRRLARVGTFARGLVFQVIGVSLLTAAWSQRASDADSFGEALGQLARQPFGVWLLTFVASGLLAYAVHLFFVSRYGHLPEPR